MITLKRKRQVVMLPTNKKATDKPFSTRLTLCNDGILRIGNPVGSTESRQELYFLSDDEIKEGDWFYCSDNTNYSHVFQAIGFTDDTHIKVKSNNECGYGDWNKCYSKKIIATTDNNISINLGLEKWMAPTNSNDDLVYTRLAPYPQPSPQFIQKFIKEWNKGNKIEWIDVEYEIHFDEDWTDEGGAFEIEYERLKVDKNNYITITKVKDSWSKEELPIDIFKNLIGYIDNPIGRKKYHPVIVTQIQELKNWIEENL